MKLPLSLDDIHILKLQITHAVEAYMEAYEHLDHMEKEILPLLTGEQVCSNSECRKPLEKVRTTGDPNTWKCLNCQKKENNMRTKMWKKKVELKSTA